MNIFALPMLSVRGCHVDKDKLDWGRLRTEQVEFLGAPRNDFFCISQGIQIVRHPSCARTVNRPCMQQPARSFDFRPPFISTFIFSLQVLPGNANTYSVANNSLDPALIASKIRLAPYSDHPRTVCLRVGLRGCPFNGTQNRQKEQFPENRLSVINWLAGTKEPTIFPFLLV
jgi:hypothetical protein